MAVEPTLCVRCGKPLGMPLSAEGRLQLLDISDSEGCRCVYPLAPRMTKQIEYEAIISSEVARA